MKEDVREQQYKDDDDVKCGARDQFQEQTVQNHYNGGTPSLTKRWTVVSQKEKVCFEKHQSNPKSLLYNLRHKTCLCVE